VRGDVTAWKGSGDASFRFGTASDDKYEYVAVDEVDDRVVPWVRGQGPSAADRVEIRLDARPAKDRPAIEPRRGENDRFALIASSPGATPEETFVATPRQIPPGTKVVSTRTPTGYFTEFAIPVSYLDEKSGGDWSSFRLNVTVTDRDDPPGGGATELWWRADWHSNESYLGSGTFERK
jgi:hypothetical protein